LIEFITRKDQKEKIAEKILQALPDWFGVEKYTREYIKQSSDMPFWAYKENIDYVGFISLKKTADFTAEIYVMGILPQYHRQGIGKQLFAAFESYAKVQGYEYVQVKTVERGHYDEYDKTVSFYESLGFRALEVFPTLWDEHNPCLVMVKSVT